MTGALTISLTYNVVNSVAYFAVIFKLVEPPPPPGGVRGEYYDIFIHTYICLGPFLGLKIQYFGTGFQKNE